MENGYVRVPNDFIKAVLDARLDGNSLNCLLFIVRTTWGYNRQSARIKQREIADAIGVARQTAWRSINALCARSIVLSARDKGPGIYYSVNKKYAEWVPSEPRKSKQNWYKKVNKTGTFFSATPIIGNTKDKVYTSYIPGRASPDRHFSSKYPSQLNDIKQLCELLLKLPKKGGKPWNPYQWVQRCANRSRHPQAIVDTLSDLSVKWHSIRQVWPYAEAVVAKLSARFNEEDHIRQAKEFKDLLKRTPLSELIKNIGDMDK